MSEHLLRVWHLSTTAFTCMSPSCSRPAQVVVNVWVREREWLVVFLCTACLFKARCETAMLQRFLGEKRVNVCDIQEPVAKKRGRVA
jgi:hypothetical protein